MGVKMNNNSLIDELVSDGDNGVKVIIDSFSYKLFLFYHGEDLSDTVNDSFHDKIILFLLTNEIDLQFMDDLQ